MPRPAARRFIRHLQGMCWYTDIDCRSGNVGPASHNGLRVAGKSAQWPSCRRDRGIVVALLPTMAPAIMSDSSPEGGYMASIIIRGLDESAKKRLAAQAKEHGRSMEAKARDILSRAIRRPHIGLALLRGTGRRRDRESAPARACRCLLGRCTSGDRPRHQRDLRDLAAEAGCPRRVDGSSYGRRRHHDHHAC